MDAGRDLDMHKGASPFDCSEPKAERRHVEATLEEKAARLQAILDTTVDGIITIDECAIIKSFNRAAERIFGYSASEVIGCNVKILQPSPYREHHDEFVANYLRTGIRKIIGIGREVTGRRKDGSTFPLYLAVSEVRVGEQRYFAGILRDLSAQKAAMEEIRNLARFPEENPYPIMRLAKDGTLLYANEASGCLLEAWNTRLGQIVPDLWCETVLEVLDSGIPKEQEAQCGATVYSLTFIPTPHERDINVYGKDITERKQAQRELEEYRDHLEEMVIQRTRELEEAHKSVLQEEKLKTLGAISAEMAHEIRNPLMSIGGFARRLQKRFPEMPEIGIIVQESGRLEEILKRIENYLKPVELRPRECSVNNIIQDAIDFISPELEREKIALHLALSRELPPAYVDPGILIQVLVNVIHNAAKVMRKDGRITIETYESDQNVHITVHAPLQEKLKDPEHVFMPFGEDRETISVPLCFRMLRSMGGYLSLAQEGNAVVFAASLLKVISGMEDQTNGK